MRFLPDLNCLIPIYRYLTVTGRRDLRLPIARRTFARQGKTLLTKPKLPPLQ
jgi:hypothetical protein